MFQIANRIYKTHDLLIQREIRTCEGGEGKGVWGRGYFVSTVSLDETTIQHYVEFQGREDTGQATLEL